MFSLCNHEILDEFISNSGDFMSVCVSRKFYGEKEKIKFLEIKDNNVPTPTFTSELLFSLSSLEIPSTIPYIVPSSSESTDDSTQLSKSRLRLPPILHSCIKHFELNFYFIERRFKLKLFQVLHIPSFEQTTDLLPKANSIPSRGV